jgi:predicted metal-dependent phosphoesterase TrpH
MNTHQLPIHGDFHLHSCYSPDCDTQLEEIIAAVEHANLNCVAITDHDTIEGAQRLQELAKFRVIIGEEISSAGGHIIGLFLKERVPPGLTLMRTIEAIKQQGGIAVAPHPFASLAQQSLKQDFSQHAHLFDAVETHNSNNLFRWEDWKAKREAVRHGLPAIGGSDAHLASGIGSNRVLMPDFCDADTFLQALESASIKNRLHPLSYFIKMGRHDVAERLSQRRPSKKLKNFCRDSDH